MRPFRALSVRGTTIRSPKCFADSPILLHPRSKSTAASKIAWTSPKGSSKAFRDTKPRPKVSKKPQDRNSKPVSSQQSRDPVSKHASPQQPQKTDSKPLLTPKPTIPQRPSLPRQRPTQKSDSTATQTTPPGDPKPTPLQTQQKSEPVSVPTPIPSQTQQTSTPESIPRPMPPQSQQKSESESVAPQSEQASTPKPIHRVPRNPQKPLACNPPSPSSDEPPEPIPKQSRYAAVRSAISDLYAPLLPRFKSGRPFVISLAVGLIGGAAVSTLYTIYFSPAAEPGTKADDAALADLEKRIDEEFKVKIFRGKCLAPSKAIKGEEGGWVEIHTRGEKEDGVGKVRRAELRFEREKRENALLVKEREAEIIAKSGEGAEIEVGKGEEERIEGLRQQAKALGLEFDPEKDDVEALSRRFAGGDGADLLIKEALKGSRGLAVERVFWNSKDAELVAVVWLGKALCGWPGTVHGGLLATVLGEKCGMAASLLRDQVVGSQGKHASETDWRDLKELDIQYRKPTYAGDFYTIRAFPRVVKEGRHNMIEVESVLETMDGKVCVEVKGIAPSRPGQGISAALEESWTSWLRRIGWTIGLA